MKLWEEEGKIKIATPAKINLFLEILGKRDDGYHEIETIMQKVNLYDYISIEKNEKGIEFTCSNQKLPIGPDNLVLKAVQLIQKEAKIFDGVKIHLEKNIPVGAGLGGGSSDAAATLVGLNRLWGLGYDEDRLRFFAGRLGSDTPFFLSGNTALCKGRGEKIKPCMIDAKFHYILVYPRREVSTAKIYKNFKNGLTKNLKDVNLFSLILESSDPEKIGKCLFNRLEGSVFSLYPDIEKIKKTLSKFDFCGVLVSGSGSALYGLCKGESDTKKIKQKLKKLNIGDVFVVTNDSEGTME